LSSSRLLHTRAESRHIPGMSASPRPVRPILLCSTVVAAPECESTSGTPSASSATSSHIDATVESPLRLPPSKASFCGVDSSPRSSSANSTMSKQAYIDDVTVASILRPPLSTVSLCKLDWTQDPVQLLLLQQSQDSTVAGAAAHGEESPAQRAAIGLSLPSCLDPNSPPASPPASPLSIGLEAHDLPIAGAGHEPHLAAAIGESGLPQPPGAPREPPRLLGRSCSAAKATPSSPRLASKDQDGGARRRAAVRFPDRPSVHEIDQDLPSEIHLSGALGQRLHAQKVASKMCAQLGIFVAAVAILVVVPIGLAVVVP